MPLAVVGDTPAAATGTRLQFHRWPSCRTANKFTRGRLEDLDDHVDHASYHADDKDDRDDQEDEIPEKQFSVASHYLSILADGRGSNRLNVRRSARRRIGRIIRPMNT